MAHRVATEFVNVNLTVPAAEMPRLVRLFELQQLRLQVFVLDGGNQEVALEDSESGESVRMTFEFAENLYRCRLTCRIVKPRLTNAIRKMVQMYRGDAVVNRIYAGFTMVYHYRNGSVVRIAECKKGSVRSVYERRDLIGKLEAKFQLRTVEDEIDRLKQSVNELLDRRNLVDDRVQIDEIDRRLQHHSRMLFILEA